MSDLNEKDIREWLDLSEDCSHRILFLGAGIPANLGLPTWREFARQARDEHMPKKQIEIDQALEDSNFIRAMTLIKNEAPDRFAWWLSEKPSSKVDASSLLAFKKILEKVISSWSPTAIWTTNFDQATAKLFDPRDPIWQGRSLRIHTNANICDARKRHKDKQPYILYLHGSVTEGELADIVIDEHTYDKWWIKDDNFVPSLKEMLHDSAILFLGTSLSDTDFNELLIETHKTKPMKQRTRMALLSERKDDALLSSAGIRPIYCELGGDQETATATFRAHLEGIAKIIGEHTGHAPQPEKGERNTITPEEVGVKDLPKPASVVREVAKVEAQADPYLRLRQDLQELAGQQLWQGLCLYEFENIESKVEILSGPFEQRWQDSNVASPTLKEFISDFFLAKKWNPPKQKEDGANPNSGQETQNAAPLSFVVLSGDAGVGKSTALQKLAADYARGSRCLALYANLADVFQHGRIEFESRFNDYLEERGYETLNQLIRRHGDRFESLIILLDAFDEAALKTGESRISILSQIIDFCRESGVIRKSDGTLDAEPPLRGVLVATRQDISFAEEQLLSNATIIRLKSFEPKDVRNWLTIFHRAAKSDLPLESLKSNGDHKALRKVISTPLFLYLLAASNAVDSRKFGTVLRGLSGVAEEKRERRARFLILNTFTEMAADDAFLERGAFNLPEEQRMVEINRDDKSGSNRELLFKFASEAARSTTRQIGDFDEWSHADLQWITHALPMEPVKYRKEAWRFSHFTIVEYLVARGIADNMVETSEKIDGAGGLGLWKGKAQELQDLTIRAARLPISERTFEYMEQILVEVRRRRSDAQFRRLAEIAEFWAGLDAILVPEKAAREELDHGYYACRRQLDIGLSIAHLGLPLHLVCKRLLNDNEIIGAKDEKDALGRYRFRQYLHLSSYHVGNRRPQQADVRRLPFRNLKSSDASFEGADMINLILDECEVRNSQLRNTNLLGAFLNSATIGEDCDLQGASLAGAWLRAADLKGVTFEWVNMYKVKLMGADLRGATLKKCNLSEANMRGADLRGATFEGCTLIGVDFYGAKMDEAQFRDVVLMGPVNLEHVRSARGAVFERVTGLEQRDAKIFHERKAQGVEITKREAYRGNEKD